MSVRSLSDICQFGRAPCRLKARTRYSDKQGRPDAVKYDRIGVYLLEVVKELRAENELLKERIGRLEECLNKE